MRPSNPLLYLAAVVAALGVWPPRPATAATFDETTGQLRLGPAAFSISFDDPQSIPPELGAEFFDEWEQPLDPEFVTDPNGLEGAGALSFGGVFEVASFDLTPLWSELSGRRVELRIWQRPLGTRASVHLLWGQGPLTGPDEGLLLGMAPVLPTGRATDDGWVEYSTGPFDFAAGGVFGPAQLLMADVQPTSQGREDYAWRDPTARVLIDALEIVDLGPAVVPDASCNMLDEADRCGPLGVCQFGRCVDGAIVNGPVPQTESIRHDYLTRRINEYAFYEGGRLPQDHMVELQAVLDGLRSDSSAATFWPGIKRGIEKLWDGHAFQPTMSWGPYAATNLGICVHLGHADLLPTGGTAPLVFEVTGTNPAADLLQEGDVLVAIDGKPPYVWANAAKRLIRYNGDPEGFAMVVAPGLVRAAVQAAATLTFERCPYTGPGLPTPCATDELETITVDLGELFGQRLWSDMLPTWYDDEEECDYRFRRELTEENIKDYDYAGAADDGPIRTLIINGVPSYWETPQWFTTVGQALEPPPQYLIVDQRTGHGGDVTTVDFMMGMLVLPEDFHRMELLPSFDRPLDEALWDALSSCQGYDCGGYFRWPLGGFVQLGTSRGVAGSIRVAVLNAFDVSGNDYTSKLFTYRSAETRIYSAAPSYGAFGPISSLPVHMDEVIGGSVQVYDTIFVAQPQDPLVDFTTGTGVAPDTVVWQRQSDAVQGIDTAIAAAKQWLTE